MFSKGVSPDMSHHVLETSIPRMIPRLSYIDNLGTLMDPE